jgi:hypothetical protein
MFVAPVVVHLSRLVADREERPDAASESAGEESKAPSEGEDTKVHYETEVHSRVQADKIEDNLVLEESAPLKEKRTPSRKPIRIRRVRQTKVKAKRYSKSSSPSTGAGVKCGLAFALVN